ncbi:MAG: hypothetical protein LBK83_07610, partial [Treponema sp.]|nr:hypothetical protein [Treponema sp.]
MIQIRERFPLRGNFGLRVYRKGILIEGYHDHNRIVDGARRYAARLFALNLTHKFPLFPKNHDILSECLGGRYVRREKFQYGGRI